MAKGFKCRGTFWRLKTADEERKLVVTKNDLMKTTSTTDKICETWFIFDERYLI